eukprot:9475964-Pyramimonas_sp.AAC.1
MATGLWGVVCTLAVTGTGGPVNKTSEVIVSMPRGSGHPLCLPNQPRLENAVRRPLKTLTRNMSTELEALTFAADRCGHASLRRARASRRSC